MVIHDETIAIFGAHSVIRSSYPIELDSRPVSIIRQSGRIDPFSEEEPLDLRSITPRWWPTLTSNPMGRTEAVTPRSP